VVVELVEVDVEDVVEVEVEVEVDELVEDVVVDHVNAAVSVSKNENSAIMLCELRDNTWNRVISESFLLN
jgi:hypothetical protein